MTKQENTPTDAPSVAAAEQAVANVEALPVDAADPNAFEEARGAVDTLSEAAEDIVFPTNFAPTTGAALDEFRYAVELSAGLPFESAVLALAGIHEDAIESHDELARIVRGPFAQRLLMVRAKNMTAGDPVGWATAFSAARADYMLRIAAQILTRADHPLHAAATIVAKTAPELRRRLAAVERRREEHAKGVAERQRQEAARQEQARRDAERKQELQVRGARLRGEDLSMRELRRKLGMFYAQYPDFTFTINGAARTGAACVAALEEGDDHMPYFGAQATGEPPPRA